MVKEKISKRFITGIITVTMAISFVGTALAGNVWGDDGSHLKLVTSAGELDSLPKTNFNGQDVYLLLANSMIWVSSEGTTADASTINFWLGRCTKDDLISKEHINDINHYGESEGTGFYYADSLTLDKHYSAFGNDEKGNNLYVVTFEDNEDGSWQRFFYMLDESSTSTAQSPTASGWKQDSIGWWYLNADGSYTKSAWQVINGKYYYFNETGYMLSETTTPDGYQVDASGAWVQ